MQTADQVHIEMLEYICKETNSLVFVWTFKIGKKRKAGCHWIQEVKKNIPSANKAGVYIETAFRQEQ